MISDEEKSIQFYKKFIEAEEQELEWMYRGDEEYYRDCIEQKELLIKGWRNILNLITKLKEEINILKSENSTAWEDWNNLEQCSYETELELKNKLKEKDNQIDLMAEKLRKSTISLAAYKGSYDDEMINYVGNIKSIKQYFETKAKKGE